ncbi:uncharacterized protein LOC128987508 isoform X1 [Macrosteles quadrilineatus]|uniref:uncharacterized protein LOC128987508 isoform X1 n=1 Tax=Macrosteles quadrilineatus TaxID=74068 RepID=UPI0023E0CB2B|nr:uncharacterized protein LOC128987508 isoform X1 [Macrosteles quadrilineatus]
MDLSVVLSKACTDVFRISVDEDFRREFLSILKVTNGTDAQDVLANKLKSLRQIPARIATSNTPTASGSSSSCEKITGVITGEVNDLVNEPTVIANGLRLSKTSNISEASQTIVQNEEEDEFGFQNIAYRVIGAAICQAADSDRVADLNRQTSVESNTELSRSILQENHGAINTSQMEIDNTCSLVEVAQVPSIKTAGNPQNIVLEHQQDELIKSNHTPTLVNDDEEDEFGFWDLVNDNCISKEVVQVPSIKTAGNPQNIVLEHQQNESFKSNHTPRLVNDDEEDEFGFWDLIHDNCISKEDAGTTDNTTDPLDPEPDIREPNMQNSKDNISNNASPNSSSLHNDDDDDDEFGFWDLYHNTIDIKNSNPSVKKVDIFTKMPMENGKVCRLETEEPSMAKLSQPSQSILNNQEEDEFACFGI